MHRQLAFTDSHAAAIKDTVIRVEKTMGVVKAYLQLKAVTATKQMASAHAMLRTRAKVSAGSPPSSHANIAENKRNTEKKSPNAVKPLRVKVNGSHRAKNRVHSPCGIVLAKTKCVSEGKEHQKNEAIR